jgi:hypothetical protein
VKVSRSVRSFPESLTKERKLQMGFDFSSGDLKEERVMAALNKKYIKVPPVVDGVKSPQLLIELCARRRECTVRRDPDYFKTVQF